MGWWVAELANSGQYVLLISWIFWVIFSITLHELAHGWAAIWQGDDTPIRTGHMTANPVVHMGLQSLIIFALAGIAWGAMPVNPWRFKDRKLGGVYVASAGPAMNLALALVCLGVMALWVRVGAPASAFHQNVWTFLWAGIWLNCLLGALNVLPIPPLDGSRVLAGFSRPYRELIDRPNAQIIGLFVFIAIFFLTDFGDVVLFRPVEALVNSVIQWITP